MTDFLQLLSKKPGVNISNVITEFVKSLSHHVQAPSDLVRYSACICLYSCIQAAPAVLKSVPLLINDIINGCYDDDHGAAAVCIAIVDQFIVQDPKTSVKTRNDRELLSYDSLYKLDIQSWDQPKPLSEKMLAAVKLAQPLPPTVVQTFLNALDALPESKLSKHLYVASLWLSKLDKVGHYL